MPGIYELKCGSCDYIVSGSLSATSVVLDNGSESVCPHPCEVSRAEQATGMSWTELARTNRLVYRYALVCLACGELDFYGPRDLSADNRAHGHIRSIVRSPTRSEAAAHLCKKCGAGQLYPLCGTTGCFRGILELFGFSRERVLCPKCRQGILQSKLVAIS